jgi:hypothetical protein
LDEFSYVSDAVILQTVRRPYGQFEIFNAREDLLACCERLSISSGGQSGRSWPRWSPIWARTSFSSLSDFRPKFGIRRSSACALTREVADEPDVVVLQHSDVRTENSSWSTPR